MDVASCIICILAVFATGCVVGFLCTEPLIWRLVQENQQLKQVLKDIRRIEKLSFEAYCTMIPPAPKAPPGEQKVSHCQWFRTILQQRYTSTLYLMLWLWHPCYSGILGVTGMSSRTRKHKHIHYLFSQFCGKVRSKVRKEFHIGYRQQKVQDHPRRSTLEYQPAWKKL